MQDLEPITWGVSEIASRAGLSGAVKAWVSQWLSGWSLDSRCILMRSEHAACFKFENFNAVQVPWVPWVPWVSGCLRMSQGPRGYLWPMVTYFYIDCHNYMWPPGAAGKTIRVGWYPCTYPVLPNGCPAFADCQAECWKELYLGHGNMVVTAPTGAGKTVLFELAILGMQSPQGKGWPMNSWRSTLWHACPACPHSIWVVFMMTSRV